MLPTVLAPDCPPAPSFPAGPLVHYAISRHPPNMQHQHLSHESGHGNCFQLFRSAFLFYTGLPLPGTLLCLSQLAKGYSHKPHTFVNITTNLSEKSFILGSQPKYPSLHGLPVPQHKFLFTTLASPTRLGVL